MWDKSVRKFKAGKFEFDPHIDAENDKRYGITLRACPSAEIKERVSKTLKKLKAVAPHQYYYPQSDLHITILSIISCYDGFSLKQINTANYKTVIDEAIPAISPFNIRFKGITASPSCILVQGFPENNQLDQLRDNLRYGFNQTNLQHSIDDRYRLETAHLTAVRFKHPLVKPGSFIKQITGLRDTDFGNCRIEKLELVGNDWYQREEKVKVIHTFNL